MRPFRPLAAVFLLLLAACGGGEGPAERLRVTIGAMESAAESRDLGDFMAHVSRDYGDDEGRSWEEVRRIAAYEILRNQRLFLFHRIKSLELTDSGRATAVVLVAMAGQPVEDVGELLNIQAELYRFEVEFRDVDGWKVVSANWRPAQAVEFVTSDLTRTIINSTIINSV